jgi:hypothetical protein
MQTGGWIARTCRAAMLTLIVNGCVSGRTSDSPVCSRTEPQRTALAAALVADGGPQSMAAGRTLIATIDAGC